jgi:hypothetical protein
MREALLAKQNGQCALCAREIYLRKYWYVAALDHDHTTGRIRGILCYACNYNLGALETEWRKQRFDPAWLGRARRYVAPWRRA